MAAQDRGNVAPQAKTEAMGVLNRIIAECEACGASDIHLTSGGVPFWRVHGKLARVPNATELSREHLHAIADELLVGYDWDPLTEMGALDGSICATNGTRFRFNIFRKQMGLSIALRRLEGKFRNLAELGLPDSLYSLCDLPDGLVIIGGPSGAGKSTTLATLIDRINRTREAHIITIEDPVEFLHEPASCLVNQRQVGVDAETFNDALVSALRQDPDVIMVGEMRDEATIRTAITAAETGHLVFATMHGSDATGTIERLLSVFRSDEQESLRRQLSEVLRTVVVQHLLPGKIAQTAGGPVGAGGARPVAERRRVMDPNYKGPERRGRRDRASQRTGPRVLAYEIMVVTPAIAGLIANGQLPQIYSYMETGAEQGMQTLEKTLAKLCVTNKIWESTAIASSRHPKAVREMIAVSSRR